MAPLRNNNPGLRFLLAYWQRYCVLEDWHISWAKRHIHIVAGLHKGDTLYLEGEKQKHVYLVARGLLARVRHDEDTDKRQILSVALPGMALMTTSHLYSNTPSAGNIVTLRTDSIVVQIPYRAIREFKEQEPQLNTLIAVLTNKKKKQLTALSGMMHEPDSFARYLLFAKDMPEVQEVLTQVEQAALLGIARKTVQRAQYYLLTGKRPEN